MQGCGIKYLPTEEELSREIREQKEFFELQKGKEAEDEDQKQYIIRQHLVGELMLYDKTYVMNGKQLKNSILQ